MNNVAKFILASAIALISTAAASQSADYKYMIDCTSNGSIYQYSQSKCSYDNTLSCSRTDYYCQNNCTNKG